MGWIKSYEPFLCLIIEEIMLQVVVAGVFDVKPYLYGSAFKELEDELYFCPGHHGIMWPHDDCYIE